jgi:hypothetical protein
MVREVELRVARVATPAAGTPATCRSPAAPAALDAGQLYDPQRFPEILRAQTDLMVLAMSCGLTRVGLVQASHHTSELLMSRFPNTEFTDRSFDMRSHQASHYGAQHDPAKREFRAYVAQVRWFVQQFAYLLEALRQRPDGSGTMLDSSLVLLCSEISDGNTHSHDDMPFILAGRGGGAVRTGRLLAQARPHAELLSGIARAMGAPAATFGQAASAPLPGLLA